MPRDEQRRREWYRQRYATVTRAQRIEWRKGRIAAGLCSNCGARPAGETRQLCDFCARRVKETGREYNARARRKVFEVYGGPICVCCGETEDLFLTVDHLDNNGAVHRREIESASGTNNLYIWLKKQGYPPGYQVLCQNCNVGKFRNGGVCPHTRLRSGLP